MQLDDFEEYLSPVLDMFRLKVTPRIVDPAGMFPAMSKASTPRRSSPMPVSPAKKCWPSALLTVAFRGIVLIERIVLNGVNISKLARDRQTGNRCRTKRGLRSRSREVMNFTEKVAGWIFILI